MRAVVQRVTRAQVVVAGASVGRIDAGLLALVGVAHADGPEDVRRMADKLVHLRVFADAEGKMNRSLLDVDGELAIVSQFTLFGDCRKGRRPSYHQAAPPDAARACIDALVDAARALGARVATGSFREHMQVELVNDGPVTLLLDTSGVF